MMNMISWDIHLAKLTSTSFLKQIQRVMQSIQTLLFVVLPCVKLIL
jgi:hypothetical protein